MSISDHTRTITVTVGGSPVTLPVLRGEVTADEEWSPYVQGSVELAQVASNVWAALDPKQNPVPRVTVDLEQSFGTWNAFTRADTSLSTELVVRSRRRRRTGEVTLTLESDEALAQDYRSLEPMPLWLNQTDYVDAIDQVLTFIGASIGSAPPDTTVDGGLNFFLEPGQTLWDAIEPILQHAGLRLFVWDGVWTLVPHPQNVDGQIILGHDPFDNVLDATDEDVLDATDEDGYFDAVIIGYSYDDTIVYDIAQVTSPTKVLALQYDIPYPGGGAAKRVLNRRLQRGEGRNVTAVANYDVRPGMALAILTGDSWSMGRVAAVTWSLRERSMTIRARAVTEAAPTVYAWLLAPPGKAWTDIALGVKWTDYAP